MRPENLKFPFSGTKRQTMVQDRIWYVPSYGEETSSFTFPGWDHPDFFNGSKPINIEYCSGNGAWIANRACTDSSVNWVAVERKFERARKIWSKVKNHHLDNLLVVCGEGFHMTQKYLPAQSVQNVFVNFPDPWPKKKHAKHRIIQMPFAEEMHRILQVGGSVCLVTDDADYSNIMIDVFQQCPGFESVYPAPYFMTGCEEYGTSYFDQLWREKGKVIRYHQFRKR